MQVELIVTTTFEACHNYRDAPAEVWFLKHSHRHLFHVRAHFASKTTDRDLEFIMLKRRLEEHLNTWRGQDLGDMSCEKMALRLAEAFDMKRCRVMEDGENGAEVSLADEE